MQGPPRVRSSANFFSHLIGGWSRFRGDAPWGAKLCDKLASALVLSAGTRHGINQSDDGGFSYDGDSEL